MDERRTRPLKGKVILRGRMICDTGLHIGAAGNNLEIGGLDSPVVRDPVTREPYVPGSSLKGKMRSLLERKLNLPFNRYGGNGVYRHECTNRGCRVCRLFGAAGGREGDNIPGRLIVRDLSMTAGSREQLAEIETGLQYTEWKFENSLDRVTAAANPRQLERVPRGTEFDFELIYTVETGDEAVIKEDLNHVVQLLRLVEDDTLGGHGSRGYGKVRFEVGSFEGRRIDYYAGEKDALLNLPVKTTSECTAVVDQMAAFFNRENC
ncbi:type III-A CRISPR-associated RAMP protein Csm3 [Desulfotomaculum copahuensis]|uniref:CRISPR system Cms endoribonuclease Csm3 n=1 Tax=Desulfotomaculum copahuensis TaxID=1838280 RepID=A0A1B7LCC3_9FIRM|nr:type III-A CRISPR-associated RAMP protein Csm3 [Desulfotomaculum copahuensis]OAT80407.1 type III-A CRISPR-associated RAMP protein Csm3 [Desulfotomaculum copahuensis]